LIQAEQPAFLAGSRGAFLGLRNQHGIEARQLIGIGHVMEERVGRIHHVFFELRGQARELQHHGLETLLAGAVQSDARKAKFVQRVVDDRELFLVERGSLIAAHGGKGAEQPFVLAQIGAVLRQQRQAGVVAFAQRLIVHYTVEVADG
jgi:hypothetical protein